MTRSLLLALACCAAVHFASVPEAFGGQREIEERLACQCGCGLTVHSCNHLQCSFAVPAREKVAEALAAGQTQEEILQNFVKEYGEKVLSSPTTKGFNLLAWWGPYIALLLGGLAVFVAIRRLRVSRGPELEESLPSAAIPSEIRSRLENELDEVEL